jgi:adenosine deaminase
VSPAGFADLHLHFEGSIPEETLVGIAARNGHHFSIAGRFPDLRRQIHDSRMFLRLYADCCRIFRTPSDYAEAAGAVARALSGEVAHAEIYVSPEIWTRFGLDAGAVLGAIDGALAEAESKGGPRVLLLLDAVRQWGPESAEQVLDLFERARSPRIVGFGIGGDEASRPASDFRAAYERAQRLGLQTSIHAGEWAGASSVTEALDSLPLDRIDHGIRAAEDPSLLERLSREKIPLCVAPTSNIVTGAVASWKTHPLPELFAAGVRVCLSADDPTLFETSTREEFARVRRHRLLSAAALETVRENAWEARFGR